MKKSVFVVLAACSLLVLSGVTGRAGTVWDIDIFAKHLSATTRQYTNYFDITSKYDPAVEKITYAKAWFALCDDYDPTLSESEWVAVDLGNEAFLDPIKINFVLVGSGQITGDAFLTLDETGKLKYTIRRTKGDFWALGAKLLVETCPRAVPDGGATLMLLGVALAGIESLRHRTARGK